MHPENVLSLFIGTWSLLNVSSTQNGIPNTDPGLGPRPAGLLLYHPDGRMSAALASTRPQDRPANLTWPFRPQQGDRDWALVGKHAIAYMGPFQLNASVPLEGDGDGGVKGEMVHGPLDVASLPSFVGTRQRRPFEIARGGELLHLQSDLGNGTRMGLWWQKV